MSRSPDFILIANGLPAAGRGSASMLQHLFGIDLLEPAIHICKQLPVEGVVGDIVDIVHLDKSRVGGMAAVDLVQALQKAVCLAVEADELPEDGKAGGLD